MKTCIVYKATNGYWAISTDDYEGINELFDTELEAYKYANQHGYRVR